MKVLLPDEHNVSSTLIKLDASIVLRLCVFLDEPVLKQLEVRFLKGGDKLCVFNGQFSGATVQSVC